MKTLYEYLARLEYDNGWEEAKRILNEFSESYRPQTGSNYASYITSKLEEQDRLEAKSQLELLKDWA